MHKTCVNRQNLFQEKKKSLQCFKNKKKTTEAFLTTLSSFSATITWTPIQTIRETFYILFEWDFSSFSYNFVISTFHCRNITTRTLVQNRKWSRNSHDHGKLNKIRLTSFWKRKSGELRYRASQVNFCSRFSPYDEQVLY